MLRRFECKTGGHNKAWSIDYPATMGYKDGISGLHSYNCNIRWGRIGGTEQKSYKNMSGTSLSRLIEEKLVKGYVEVLTNTVHTKPVTIKPDLKKMSKLLGNDQHLI